MDAFCLPAHVPNRANRQAERERLLGVDHHKTAFIPSEIKVTSWTREPDGLVHQLLLLTYTVLVPPRLIRQRVVNMVNSGVKRERVRPGRPLSQKRRKRGVA
jgi:hypothetical protein